MKERLRKQLEKIIYPVAARYETKPEHWICGDDESLSWCYECAEKRVKELEAKHPEDEFFTRGGYATEGDSQAFCEGCGFPLDNSYTDYCCETELDHFEEHGFDATHPSDCHSLTEILITDPSNLSDRIEALARKIVKDHAAQVKSS